MGVLWWMEASLTLILISPCIFIMAPQVTPARCMKCPASCHPCPLSLYLCNVFLLPSLFLSHSLSSTHFYLFGSFRRHKCLFSPYKRDILLEPRKGCVLFPFSESIIVIVSVLLLVFLALGFPFFPSHRYTLSEPSFSQNGERQLKMWRVARRWTFSWIHKKENLAGDVSTPTLPC